MEWLKKNIISQQYVAPDSRIRISENLTFDMNNQIPAFTDVQGETLEKLVIPEALVYTYADVNHVVYDEFKLKQAVEWGAEKGNLIKCECCSKDKNAPFVKSCYGNMKCPCYQTNKAMQALQKTGGNITEFGTHTPILFYDGASPFYDTVGFACSELCGCKGKCNNNALMIAKSYAFPLEIFRRNLNIGFELRSPVFIPIGTPFLEFLGEISNPDNPDSRRRHGDDRGADYAYQLSVPVTKDDEDDDTKDDDTKDDDTKDDDTKGDDRWIKFVLTHKHWTPKYAKLLEEILKMTFICNPKTYGNAARTMSHSCSPNCEIIRIYQKSLSPAHCRLVVVTLQDIPPGVPLTIDYGKKYIEDHLGDRCQCGTFACENGPDFHKYETFDIRMIALSLLHFSKKQMEVYKKTVASTPEDLVNAAKKEAIEHKEFIRDLEEKFRAAQLEKLEDQKRMV